MSMFDLPLPLHEFIGSGDDPRSVLDNRFSFLLEGLTASLWLSEPERDRRASCDLFEADQLAADVSLGPFAARCDEDRYRMMASARWRHDLLSDERSRAALLGLLDPIEVAEIEVEADQMLRPAPLEASASTGQQCDSCGAHVPEGERMLTFEVRYEPTAPDSSTESMLDSMPESARDVYEWLNKGLDDVRTEERLMATGWYWCTQCVLAELAD